MALSRRVTAVLPVVPSLLVHDACMDIKCMIEGQDSRFIACNLVMVERNMPERQ